VGDHSPIEFNGITPYLHYDNIVAMIEWLARVFGFTEKGRWLEARGAVRSAELAVGATELWLDGDSTWWKSKGRRPRGVDWGLGQ
jgi:uncharacterized glyoxalase superfamily protein PhnB